MHYLRQVKVRCPYKGTEYLNLPLKCQFVINHFRYRIMSLPLPPTSTSVNTRPQFSPLSENLPNSELGGINHSAVANRYNNLTKEAKQNLFQHAIVEVLSQIREEKPDKNLDAYNALIGIDKVTPVDIYTYGASNMFFIPDAKGSKTGILVNLNSPDKPYTHIQQQSDFNKINDTNFRQNFTSWEKQDGRTYSGVDTALEGIQGDQGGWNLGHFNQNEPRTINISELSEDLVDRLDYHVTQENNKDQTLSNLLLNVLPRSAKGAAREPLGVSASGIPFQLEVTFEGLTPTEALRGIQSPFSQLAKYFDLLIASTNGSDLQDVEYSQERAESIGAWIDTGTQLVMSASGIGAAVSVLQQAAGLTADVIEGNEINPLDVVSLSLAVLPGGKIVAKLSKVSNTLGQVVRGGISIAETGVDIVGSSRDLIEGFKKGNYTDIINGLVSVASSSASGRPGKLKIDHAIKNGNPETKIPTPTYRNNEGEVRPIPTAQNESFFEKVAIEAPSGQGPEVSRLHESNGGSHENGMGGNESNQNPNSNKAGDNVKLSTSTTLNNIKPLPLRSIGNYDGLTLGNKSQGSWAVLNTDGAPLTITFQNKNWDIRYARLDNDWGYIATDTNQTQYRGFSTINIGGDSYNLAGNITKQQDENGIVQFYTTSGPGGAPGEGPRVRKRHRDSEGESDSEDPSILHRAIRPDERPSQGLFAPDNAIFKEPATHVSAGSRAQTPSTWISLSRSRGVAAAWADPRNGGSGYMVVADLPTGAVLDLTDQGTRRELFGKASAGNFAAGSQEVLFDSHKYGPIPPEYVKTYKVVPLNDEQYESFKKLLGDGSQGEVSINKNRAKTTVSKVPTEPLPRLVIRTTNDINGSGVDANLYTAQHFWDKLPSDVKQRISDDPSFNTAQSPIDPYKLDFISDEEFTGYTLDLFTAAAKHGPSAS